MFLFYVDECGDTAIDYEHSQPQFTLSGKHSAYFTLSAVGIRDSSRKPMADGLFEIKRKHFGNAADDEPWQDTEIKGRYLSRAARSVASGTVLKSPMGYRSLDTPEKVSGLVRDLGLLIDKHRPIILSATIDKSRLVSTQPLEKHEPLGAAYSIIHERIALSLEKLYTGESAILIADQQADHERFFRSGEMNRRRREISSTLRVQPNFDLVVDKPLWLDTELSSWDRELLQVADIVAYSTTNCVQRGRYPEHESFLWPQITRSMAMHWRTGDIHQAGFTVYPRGRKYYPVTK